MTWCCYRKPQNCKNEWKYGKWPWGSLHNHSSNTYMFMLCCYQYSKHLNGVLPRTNVYSNSNSWSYFTWFPLPTTTATFIIRFIRLIIRWALNVELEALVEDLLDAIARANNIFCLALWMTILEWVLRGFQYLFQI